LLRAGSNTAITCSASRYLESICKLLEIGGLTAISFQLNSACEYAASRIKFALNLRCWFSDQTDSSQ
jgi:hypothetical protein